jgi:2-aminoadipate transaminase
MSRLTSSVVRDLLKVTERPDIISFAGGLPAPETFPLEVVATAHAEVFAEDGRAAMQYATTEGWRPLREWIARRMQARGVAADADRILVTTGSQQGIDLVGKVFVDPGAHVIVENPCYLAALQALSGYEASFVGVGSDDDGMRVDEVEAVLARTRVALIYLVPDFQNPKGTSLAPGRRRALLALARRHEVPIVEDDPYGELRYSGERPPPLAALDEDGLVIYLSTFSKTLSPGMRLGWVAASEPVMQALATTKQAADLHTSTIEQRAAARALASFDFDAHVARLCAAYGARRDVMLASLAGHFPAGVRWTRPDGGLFLWVELPGGMRSEDLLEAALAAGVAFVPGAPFFVEPVRHDFLRLNFSNQPPAMIEDGIARLARVIRTASRP